MVNHEINRLLHFAGQQNLLAKEDRMYAANLLLDCLQLPEFQAEEINEALETPDEILGTMLDYAVQQGLLVDTTTERDLFDTRLMNCVMPRPSEVVARFRSDYAVSPRLATDNYYRLSIASNYIRKQRIDRNIAWKTATEYGDLDITINLSKPEKDPRDIAKAKQQPAAGYPKCLLCRENEGFAGHIGHPARQTHRLIPLDLGGRPWFLQYSPYIYYNEHCIVLNEEHRPMKISRQTFVNLADFLDAFPHYFVGSNADLPIVGGSILSHDHYQGGRCRFPMEQAPVEQEYHFAAFPAVRAGRVKWPMAALRLVSADRGQLIDLADHLLGVWRGYSDAAADILAASGGEKHNTITPIARRREGLYEFDLVLRNNRTSGEHPLGIFHPHADVHHIKKENIGLIEVLGLAILPARLKVEMAAIKNALEKGAMELGGGDLAKHEAWYQELRQRYSDCPGEDSAALLRQEIGRKFERVLVHAGVFKRTAAGEAAFDRFAAAAGGKPKEE